MWRDRTNLFISYRQSFSHHAGSHSRPRVDRAIDSFAVEIEHDEDRLRLLPPGVDRDAVIDMSLLTPRWANISDDINLLLAKISTEGQRLETLHQKHVLPGFNDDETKRAEEADIEKLTREITAYFHDCHKLIHRVEQTLVRSKASATLTRTEEALSKNLQISLANRIQESSARFRKRQSAYLQKLRELGDLPPFNQAELPQISQTSSSTELSLKVLNADRSFSPATFDKSLGQKMTQLNEEAIVQRESEIIDIAQSIERLSDMFRDLQSIVIDQGTMMDRIDYNVERMNEDIRGADQDLQVASTFQRKAYKRTIILLLILILIGLFTLILSKPRSSYNKRPL